MKKTFILLIALTSIILSAQAQNGARQFVLYEHFTQASCGFCGIYNADFHDEILENNQGNIHHISYHTAWPGIDPMNAFNASEVQEKVDYYSVGDLPAMMMNGNDIGGPQNASQFELDAAQAYTSPLRVNISEEDNGDGSRTATIQIYSALDSGLDNAVLRTAVVERMINYDMMPGNNGETDFPNVFRQSLNTTDGQVISLPIVGNTEEYSFDYDLDSEWEADEVYVIAWLQEEDTKAVINSGSSIDPKWEHVPSTTNFEDGSDGDAVFLGTLVTGDQAESFTIELEHEQPLDWDAEIEVSGQSSENNLTVELEANTEADINLIVGSGGVSAIGNYRVSVTSGGTTQGVGYSVISNVWDLVITNTEAWSDPNYFQPIDAWEEYYLEGLADASNVYHAATDHFTFLRGMEQGALFNVKNIYFNVGWTLPSLTDAKVAAFEEFLDNGGNMLIAGQDIAYEISELGNATPAVEAFFENYMQASYVANGTMSNSTLETNSADAVYGEIEDSELELTYGTFFYPDIVSPLGDGSAVFNYEGVSDGAAGVRSETDDYKLVYLAVGLEMLEEGKRNEFMAATHDYFYDGTPYDPTFFCAFAVDNEVNDISCNGDNNGSIILDITPPGDYDISWADGSSATELNNLGPGIYSVFITDGSCDKEYDFEITEPQALAASGSSTNATDGNNGSLIIDAVSGAGPFNYAWADFPMENDNVVDNVGPGTYDVTIIDANGCDVSISITVACEMTASATTIVGCTEGEGAINLNITSGGSQDFNIDWGGLTATGTEAENVPSGNYNIAISNVDGCNTTTNASVAAPDPIITNTSNTPSLEPTETGSNGSVTIEVFGNPSDYTFVWDGYPEAGPILTNIGAGVYTVTVTAPNGCQDDASVEVIGFGVDIENLINDLELWPNPMTDQLNIQSSKYFDQIEIFNAIGQKVYSNDSPNTSIQINTQDWAAGMYSIQFLKDNQTYTQKMVK